jgi:glycosyltransferase involved in cell wall biosynthesis
VNDIFDRSLRVLVAHNAYQQRGGEDAVVEAEVSLLRAHGHVVELYLRHNDELRDMGTLSAAKDTVWSSRTGADLVRLVAEFRPDVVHVHNTFALISPSVYAAVARARVPVVQTLHNFRLLCLQAMFLRDGLVCEDCLGRFPWRGVLHRCYRQSAPQSAVLAAMIGLHRAIGTYRRKVCRYIALSEFSRTKFIAGGLPGERIAVKSNFADEPVLDGGLLRSGALFVGRLSPEKGTGVLARAAARGQSAVIDVIGEGPERSSLEAVSSLRLVGWQNREAVYARMREASFLVVPSVCYENFPLTVVEAFANGLPVIASRLGAMAELICDGATGLLFEAGNADDLAARMAWAQAHPMDMTRMGRAARQEYERKYTPARNYEALMGIYRDALSTGVTPLPRSKR